MRSASRSSSTKNIRRASSSFLSFVLLVSLIVLSVNVIRQAAQTRYTANRRRHVHCHTFAHYSCLRAVHVALVYVKSLFVVASARPGKASPSICSTRLIPSTVSLNFLRACFVEPV